MNFKLNFVLACVLLLNHGAVSRKLGSLKDTTVEKFPYMGVVEGSVMNCPSILISRTLLVTTAHCVANSTSVNVYLGFSYWPYSDNTEPNTQRYTSTDIIVHEDFTITESDSEYFLNDIALIRLPHPVTLANNVRPSKLVSKDEASDLEQKIVTVSGWLKEDTVMQTKELRILNLDSCRSIFGDQFLLSQEICTKSSEESMLIGNAVTWQDKVIGYFVRNHECILQRSSCLEYDTVLNLVPYLDWISENGNISITELTGDSRDNGRNDLLRKIENLEGEFEKIEQNMANTNQKIEENIRKLGAKIDTLERNIYFLASKVKSVNESVTEIKKFLNDPVVN